MEKNTRTGAVSIERGEISERKADSLPNRYLYKVKSSTRDGVISRWMEAANAYVNEYKGEPAAEDKYAYAVGDKVNYFMFADGRGLILSKVREDI
jgi:hypothetical protein